MIPWDGEEMHEGFEGCWGDRNGKECGAVVSIFGLCNDCHIRLTKSSGKVLSEENTKVIMPVDGGGLVKGPILITEPLSS